MTQETFVIDQDEELIDILSFNQAPINRRKILRAMPVYGLWWMDADQWTRYLWQGHNGTIVKSGQDPDRVLTSRQFEPGGWCYIRIFDDRVDIEAMSRTTVKRRKSKKWKNSSFAGKSTVREWLTVSITLEEYKNLVDNYLGPEYDVCCKHNFI